MNSAGGLLGIILCLVITACSSPEEVDKKPGIPGVRPKPLPTKCSQDLLARLTWRSDLLSFGYTIEVGTEPGAYSKTFTLPANQTAFLITFGRGSTYYLRATKYFNTGTTSQFQTVQVAAPTCVERAAFQKAHPSYVEPFDQFIAWANK